jgi:probable phosphoglycerate mutase
VARLLLVRHGQSTWNAESRWQGQADPPLTELGERQAEAAAERLAGSESLASVWTSDLARARRTAEVIATRVGLVPQVDGRLRERDAGEWTGLTRHEIEERYPGDLAARRSPPGFEQDDALIRRTRAALVAIGACHAGDDVLVVSHGGVVRALERQFHALGDAIPNLAGRWLQVDGETVTLLGDRTLLIDPDDVSVTVPRSL